MNSITRREFGAAISLGITGIAGHTASIARPASAAAKTNAIEPRGQHRLIYTSDPSNIATMQVGRHTQHTPTAEEARADPARREDLVRWVDNLAHNGVDIYAQAVYAQGWSLYFRSPRFEYDARPQHQRFVPMMDAGIMPLDVLIEQTHKRGMQFFAKFRMSDGHGHGKQGARFLLDNPQWLLKEFPGRPDYSFEPIRNHVFDFADEVVSRFDVDGLMFNFIRWLHCFPRDIAQQRQPVMTRLIQRVREMLDRRGSQKGKKLSFAVMVPQTLKECRALGYDVPRWVRQGLIDYLCPCDYKYADFNAPYDEFAELTRSSQCRLFPSVIPLANSPLLLRPENYRALAQNFYGQGADGVCAFNFQYHWARRTGTARYPGPPEGFSLALSYLRDLRDPVLAVARPREYRYYPLWGDSPPTGFPNNQRLVLERSTGAQGTFRFRACEQLDANARAMLYLNAQGLMPGDEVRIELNGAVINGFQRVFHAKGRLAQFGREIGPYTTIWCDVNQPPLKEKDNEVSVRLTAVNNVPDPIVIDELQLLVVPGVER